MKYYLILVAFFSHVSYGQTTSNSSGRKKIDNKLKNNRLIALKKVNKAQLSGESIVDTTLSPDGLKQLTYHAQVFDQRSVVSENKCVFIYYDNGQLKEQYSRSLDNLEMGMHLTFYKNGMLEKLYNMFEGQMVGRYLIFHENGKANVIGEYKNVNSYGKINRLSNDTAIYDSTHTTIVGHLNGSRILPKKINVWYYYDVNGELIKKEVYSDLGILVNTITRQTP